MQNIEEQALTTYKQILPLWLRYVDDTYTKKKTATSMNTLTNKISKANSPGKIEENGLLFVDCLVSRDNNKLQSTENRHTPTD